MASASNNGTITFTGHGQAGNWSDAANWAGGVLPSTTAGLSLVTTDATLNGSFTAYKVMALGNEQVSINGTLNTLSTNLCASFMVCAHATVNFSSTSVLNDAGGLLVGVHSAGTLNAVGSGSHQAVLNSRDGKLGQHQNSSGTMTLDDAAWHVSDRMFVGLSGIGSLSVMHGSTVSVAACFGIGANLGGSGSVTLSDNAHMTVGTFAVIGGNGMDTDTPPPAGTGTGIGTLTVQATSSFAVAQSLKINTGSRLAMAGGSVTVSGAERGVQLLSGGTVSGYGTISAGATHPHMVSFNDDGLVRASGGTLMIDGSIAGTGAVQIDAGSTLAITGSTIGVPAIAFTGSNGTLSLATGVADHATITGFAAGDSILMAGVDHLSWNASTDVLTLSSGTHVVDTLQFAGSYAGNAFSLTQSGGHAVIGLAPIHSTVVAH